MVVLSTDRSGFGISLCGRSLNSPSTVQIASVSSRASSTYCPLATSTTLLSPRGVAWPETTFSVAAARRSRCLSLSGLDRSSTRAGALSGAFSGGAAPAGAGTAAISAAPTATDRTLLIVLLGSEEGRRPSGGVPPGPLSGDRPVTLCDACAPCPLLIPAVTSSRDAGVPEPRRRSEHRRGTHRRAHRRSEGDTSVARPGRPA